MIFAPGLEPLRQRQRKRVALHVVLGHELVIVAERNEEHLLRERGADFGADCLHAFEGRPVAGAGHLLLVITDHA